MAGSTRGIRRRTGAANSRGSAGHTVGGCVLFSIVSAVALASVISSSAWAVHAGTALRPGLFGAAVAAAAVAQMARLRLRVGSDSVLLAWGEVGTITALCLLAAPWVPAAICTGAA